MAKKKEVDSPVKKKVESPKKKKVESPVVETAPKEETKYKGRQLLRLDKYNHRIARIVLDAELMYTFSEADELISNYGKR